MFACFCIWKVITTKFLSKLKIVHYSWHYLVRASNQSKIIPACLIRIWEWDFSHLPWLAFEAELSIRAGHAGPSTVRGKDWSQLIPPKASLRKGPLSPEELASHHGLLAGSSWWTQTRTTGFGIQQRLGRWRQLSVCPSLACLIGEH